MLSLPFPRIQNGRHPDLKFRTKSTCMCCLWFLFCICHHHHFLLGFGMDVHLIQSIKRRAYSFWFKSNSFLIVLIIACTSHHFLIIGFEMDVQTKVSKEELFLLHALIVFSQSKALKEEYVPFNSNWISDGARCALYIPSSSPVGIQSHLLEFLIDVLLIRSIGKRVCSLWFELNTWLCSLFFVHTIIVSF